MSKEEKKEAINKRNKMRERISKHMQIKYKKPKVVMFFHAKDADPEDTEEDEGTEESWS